METINTTHSVFGNITWQIVGKDKDGNLILWANLLGKELFIPSKDDDDKWYPIMYDTLGQPILWVNRYGLGACFYDPNKHNEQRFLRTDYSGKSRTLFEIEEQSSRVAGKDIDSKRWQDICQYGCNQWAVSDLRAYLNGEFFNGLPEDFRASIVPHTHKVILSRTHYDNDGMIGIITDELISSDGVKVYDVFSENNTRLTYSVMTDYIFLPAMPVPGHEKGVKDYTDFKGYNYWTMEPYVVARNMPNLVKTISLDPDTRGELRTYVTSCNASYPLIHVFPMCIVNGAAFKKGKTESFDWIWKGIKKGRELKARNEVELSSLCVDGNECTAEAFDLKDNITYRVSLKKCQCNDYKYNRTRLGPCKHIIRLGMELGIINENGLTPEQQNDEDAKNLQNAITELKEKIARASGYYHLFNTPICSNEEYSTLKERLAELEKKMS